MWAQCFSRTSKVSDIGRLHIATSRILASDTITVGYHFLPDVLRRQTQFKSFLLKRGTALINDSRSRNNYFLECLLDGLHFSIKSSICQALLHAKSCAFKHN